MKEQQPQQPNPLNDQLAAAQLAKLNLEVERLTLENTNLKKQNRWVEIFNQVGPLLTTLVAVGALIFSVTQAINAQHAERVNKIQSQIRADKEQIVDFITSEKISSVRVAFLIDDLKSLLGELPERGPEARVITEHLMRVAWELRYDQPRDFDYDVSALRRWPEYRQFWQTYSGSHRLFLTMKYYPRIEQLRAQYPPCVEKLDYKEGTEALTYTAAGRPCPELLINALIYGFKEHLAVIKETNKPELLRGELAEFGRWTDNSSFTQKLAAGYGLATQQK